MSETDILHPHGAEFTRFLHATVGEDRNGIDVSVLSAFARLNLDPWEEAAKPRCAAECTATKPRTPHLA